MPTGITPREVVWTLNKTTLYRYRSPEGRPSAGPPVLFVYALINRPYILDLRPGNSFVAHLLEGGHDVFLLDWGRFGWEDREVTLDELVDVHLPRAVARMQRAAGREDYTLFGYCMGGTMALAHAAMRPRGLAALVALTTPVDFRHAGMHRAWTDARHLDAAAVAEGLGNIPGTLIGLGNKMMRPTANFVDVHDAYAELVMAGRDLTSWRAMNQWVNDGVPFPGAAFVQWVRDLYQQNRLFEGTWEVAGEPIDLSAITAPVLTIAAGKDHIVPPAMARPLNDLVGSPDTTYLELPAGHVGVLAGSGARERLWPAVTDWLATRAA
ncbi:MAG: alpha/beta fold hydrolase [Miltoncostaeaceae bacterium]